MADASLYAGSCGHHRDFSIYPFLSITERVKTDELVVEGWIPFYAVHAAAREFTSGSYRAGPHDRRADHGHGRLHQRLQYLGQSRRRTTQSGRSSERGHPDGPFTRQRARSHLQRRAGAAALAGSAGNESKSDQRRDRRYARAANSAPLSRELWVTISLSASLRFRIQIMMPGAGGGTVKGLGMSSVKASPICMRGSCFVRVTAKAELKAEIGESWKMKKVEKLKS